MPNAQVGLFANLVPLGLIFFIFYFILIRPQQKEQREFKKMVEGLKKNDQVVTSGGIHGTVISVKEKTFVIRVDDNAKIEIDKTAVARIEKQG